MLDDPVEIICVALLISLVFSVIALFKSGENVMYTSDEKLKEEIKNDFAKLSAEELSCFKAHQYNAASPLHKLLITLGLYTINDTLDTIWNAKKTCALITAFGAILIFSGYVSMGLKNMLSISSEPFSSIVTIAISVIELGIFYPQIFNEEQRKEVRLLRKTNGSYKRPTNYKE